MSEADKRDDDNDDSGGSIAMLVGTEIKEQDENHPEDIMVKKQYSRNQNSGYDKIPF